MTVISVVPNPNTPFSTSQLTTADAAEIKTFADSLVSKVRNMEGWDWAGISAGTAESVAFTSAQQAAAYARILVYQARQHAAAAALGVEFEATMARITGLSAFDAAQMRRNIETAQAAMRQVGDNAAKAIPSVITGESSTFASVSKVSAIVESAAKAAAVVLLVAQVADAAHEAATGKKSVHEAYAVTVGGLVGAIVGGAIAVLGTAISAPFVAIAIAVIGGAYVAGKIAEKLYEEFGEGASARLRDLADGIFDLGTELSDSLSDFFDGIAKDVSSLFDGIDKVTPRRDPLTFDLGGDGLDTIGVNPAQPIFFDHEGNGVQTSSGWLLPTDGFLVLDRNGNGTIDSGAELFGDSSPLATGGKAANGFAALAQEDSNADGRVDAGDANWNNLRVWRDLNQDGVSQADELASLEATGVAAINVAQVFNSQVLPNGNRIANLGTYTKTDGSVGTMGEVGQMADIDLAQDTFTSQFADRVPLVEGVVGLPRMNGSGQVRTLLEAASLPTESGAKLLALLSQFAAATTRTGQMALIDELIFAWGATSDMPTSIVTSLTPSWRYTIIGNLSNSGEVSQSETTAVEDFAAGQPEQYAHLTALEQFNGRTVLDKLIVQTSWSSTGAFDGSYAVSLFAERLSMVNQAWATLRTSIYNTLVLQTVLQRWGMPLKLTSPVIQSR